MAKVFLLPFPPPHVDFLFLCKCTLPRLTQYPWGAIAMGHTPQASVSSRQIYSPPASNASTTREAASLGRCSTTPPRPASSTPQSARWTFASSRLLHSSFSINPMRRRSRSVASDARRVTRGEANVRMCRRRRLSRRPWRAERRRAPPPLPAPARPVLPPPAPATPAPVGLQETSPRCACSAVLRHGPSAALLRA